MPRRAAVLRLKKGRDQLARTHPWIFKGDVADASDVEPGVVVTVIDAGGRFVGRGLFNPKPALCCRIVTWEEEAVDAGFFARRLAAAVDRRARGGAVPEVARLVWSEADGLPGLVVDRYGPVVVMQFLTLGMARVRGDLVAGLRSRLGDLPVFRADDAVVAQLEGFEPISGWVDRAGPAEIVVDEGGVLAAVSPGAGHKPVSTWTRPTTAGASPAGPAAATRSTCSPTPPASPATRCGPGRGGRYASNPRRTRSPALAATSS
jgi:23S rRNA (cytosine1962-C5)-methyltransferase